MRMILQIGCILAIALGVGLIVAGAVHTTADQPKDVGQAVRSLQRSNSQVEEDRRMVTGFFGFGSGFLTLGTLGLVIPWVNVLVHGRRTGVAQSPTNPA